MSLVIRDRTGVAVALDLAPRRPVRIGVLSSPDVSTLVRRAVHADLLCRAAQRHGALADAVLVDPVADEPGVLLASYGCRPLGSGEPAVTVGREIEPPDGAAPIDLDAGPLAVRLALAGRHDDVESAAAELARWRAAVAQWAEHPSKPMCADYVGWSHDAVDDDLDTPRLLELMREVEQHPELPPGSKFETFAHLDTLLGVDLASEVGQRR